MATVLLLVIKRNCELLLLKPKIERKKKWHKESDTQWKVPKYRLSNLKIPGCALASTNTTTPNSLQAHTFGIKSKKAK